MSALRKFLLPTFLTLISLNIILSGKVSNIKVFNLDYSRNGQKVKYPIRSDKLYLEHDLEKQEDINTFKFSIKWEFANDNEAKNAKKIYDDISNDMENTQITETSMVINFSAKNLSDLKLFRENEFGSSMILEVLQKNNPVNLQIQILKDQINRIEFHDLVVKALEAKKVQKFLQNVDYDTFRFLQ